MPTFEPDFENVKATTRIFGKGEYELDLKTIIGFVQYKKDEPETITYGVTIFPKMVGKVDSRGQLTEEFAGEDVEPIKLWMHNDGSLKGTKRFLMAVAGFDKKEEKEFNEWYKSQDFSVSADEADDGSFENVVIGEGWKSVAGKHIRANMDSRLYEPEGGESREQQNFKGWIIPQQKASV